MWFRNRFMEVVLYRSVFVLGVLVLFCSASAFGFSVSEVSFRQTEDDEVVVTYRLEGVGKCRVELLMSRDGGVNYTLRPRSVRGDVGEGVDAGGVKRIVWDVLRDLPRLEGEDIVFKVVAIRVGVVGRFSGEEREFSLPGGGTMSMVWIASGEFMMGSSSSEAGRDDDEGPVHRVRISEGFWLGKYEVTVGQFSRFVSATGHSTGNSCWAWNSSKREWENRSGANWRNPGFSQTDSHPVVCVSWEDVQAYARWLSSETDASYALPTEAEWEYSCRAGTRTRWSFGDAEDQLTRYAWYGGNNIPFGTKSVGMKLSNGWGLYDMHGNVCEWVQDWYGSDYYSRSSSVDPVGPLTGSYRVVRGGCFSDYARYVRSANRSDSSPGPRYGPLGFRLLRRAN